MSVDGPPPVPKLARTPRPADPGPFAPNPAVRPTTRARLEDQDRQRAATLAAAEPGSHVRTTIAIGLGAAALAMAWKLLGPRGE